MDVVVAFAFAVGLYLIGRWGRRNAGALAPSAMSAEGRRNSARVMARGSLACQVVAWTFAALALLELVSRVSGH